MSTKKLRALIIALIAALVVGTGAYIAVDTIKTREEQAERDEANSLRLFDFDENSITKVEIKNTDGSFTIDKTSDGWSLTETNYPYEFVLNEYYINSICTYLSDITALKKLNTGDLTSYGLTEPVVLTCYEGSTPYTLYIGNPSATDEFYYAMTPDGNVVYEIDFDEGAVLRGGISYMKDPYMISFFDVDINYAKLIRKEETAFEISKDDNAWHMSQPIPDAELNSANINSMLTSLTRLQVESFVKMTETPDDLYEYHLDSPAYQLIVKNTDNQTITIDFADFDKNDGSVYLVYEETGQIATMSMGSVSFLETDASELMSDKVLSVKYADAAELAVQVDDLSFTMLMNHDENQYTLLTQDDEIDISSKNDNIQALFKSLFETVGNLSYDSLDLTADTDTDTEPTVIFSYTLTDGTETELSLIPIDDTYYWAFIDGEYTGKVIRRRALSSNTGVLTYYEKLTDAIDLSE